MGYVYATITVFIWAFWFVISRLGVSSSALSPIDIIFLRHLTASIVLLPFTYKIILKRCLVFPCLLISICIGTMYNLFSLYGLILFRSTHGAIIITGFTPIFGSLYAFLSKKEFPKQTYLALCFIVASVFLFLSGSSYTNSLFLQIVGILLLLISAFLHSFGIWNIGKYAFSPIEVASSATLFSLIAIFPFYLLWGNISALKTDTVSVLIQASYQGIGVSIIAVLLMSKAISKIGSLKMSFCTTFVPVITTFFAFLLGETVNIQDILSAILCTIGIYIANTHKQKL